jgi:hypothetical protein
MSAGGVKEPGVESRFIAQEEQPLGIRVEPANGINAGGEGKPGQGAVARGVRSELGQDAVRFVEFDEHEKNETNIVETGMEKNFWLDSLCPGGRRKVERIRKEKIYAQHK